MTLPAKTQALVDELRTQDRRCNGGHTGAWCGERATVVCTETSGPGLRLHVGLGGT